jgi:hypothetical protein
VLFGEVLMRRNVGLILGSIAFAAGAYFVSRRIRRAPRISDIHVTTADLDYQNISYEEVEAEDLVDLNVAETTDLLNIGLDQQSVDRLIENRPYRSKLELVSRMVLPEHVYASIRDLVAVAEGRDPIKVA